PHMRSPLALAQLAGAVAAIAAVPVARAQSLPRVFFTNARVFDGTRMLESQRVLVGGGKIMMLSATMMPPPGATIIDARGKTLLPGLIDSHTHSFGDALTVALVFGVTTEMDMFGDVNAARVARAEQKAGTATSRADLYSAGTLVTAPKGHGTEYGFAIPTLGSADSAQLFVDARIAEGSDYIKIIYDAGKTYGRTIPTLSKETMRAVVVAAHKRGKLAVVHIGDLAGARDAIDAGADALVHLFVDRDPDPNFGRFVAAHHAFVVPTMTVLKSITGVGGGATLVSDVRTAPYLSRNDSTILVQGFPHRPGTPVTTYEAAEKSVRQLKAAKVPILAGTDAGNPGTSHGAALHRELELLVQAGLTPLEALASATSVPARMFHLSDRGRIATGMRADLVLVNGDPSQDITATRAIEGVWKQGVRLDRDAYAKQMKASREAVAVTPSGAEDGLVSDFESGEAKAKFGAGWSVSNDAMAGGKSSGEMKVVDGGASGSTKSLAISGMINGAVPFAWAGAMFSPGAQMMAPANLSSKREIRFFAKGDGQTYRVMIFAESKGYMPLTKTFVAGPEWKEYVFPLLAFDGIDGRGIMALIFAGGPTPGAFSFQIDDVRFR
ncbi:MAG: CIA30 family protein, partial [Gemmatimonadota bacterium]|nr:CIA30 family protein [Gemmatimonadota bacterium]